jgi:DNA-binding MarR family transcriptional regulator
MSTTGKKKTTAVDPDMVRQFREDSLQRYAIDFGDWVSRGSFARARERGHEALRPAHEHILINLELSGSRMVDIARKQQVSKNAIGQLVSELESLGYVELVPDPADGRAKILRYTKFGLKLLADATQIGKEVEAEISEQIGQKKLDSLRTILREISEKLIRNSSE